MMKIVFQRFTYPNYCIRESYELFLQHSPNFPQRWYVAFRPAIRWFSLMGGIGIRHPPLLTDFLRVVRHDNTNHGNKTMPTTTKRTKLTLSGSDRIKVSFSYLQYRAVNTVEEATSLVVTKFRGYVPSTIETQCQYTESLIKNATTH